MGLLLLYFVFCYGLLLLYGNFRKKRKLKKAGKPLEGARINWQRCRRIFFRACIVIVVTTSYMYLHLRFQWMGDNNANLKAKEYFIAGQTVNVYKSILTSVFHPELPFIKPLTSLQWLIYNKGVALLPENDGEAGVWQHLWFHYHFGKKDWMYFGVRKNRPSPKMIKILDQYWFCLESMATRPFADREMEDKYLESFVGLAFSYVLYDGFYSGEFLGSATRMAKMPEMTERYRLVVKWVNDLRLKWQDKNAPRIVHDNPKLMVLSQLTLLITLHNLILGEIHAGNFNCNNASIAQYIKLRQEFYAPDKGKPAYKRVPNLEERKRIYHIAINSGAGRDSKYIIEHYCGYKVAGKVDMTSAIEFAKAENITPEEHEEGRRRDSLFDEIPLLEGGTNGRE
ncbi:MAG: hypothetical protein CSB24_06055 [Deltaproteobacteria bacterium]|nr:MAG: hypothetical protein CSB24_06055 [Deltaproteobacteria bacterium]